MRGWMGSQISIRGEDSMISVGYDSSTSSLGNPLVSDLGGSEVDLGMILVCSGQVFYTGRAERVV